VRIRSCAELASYSVTLHKHDQYSFRFRFRFVCLWFVGDLLTRYILQCFGLMKVQILTDIRSFSIFWLGRSE
jgi:hypothetical protein